MDNFNNIVPKAKGEHLPCRTEPLQMDFGGSMQKGFADKPHGQTNENLKNVLAGAIIFCSVVGVLAALHFFLPQGSKACVLMPGFCRRSESVDKRHFQELGEGYHTGPKFALSASR